MVAAWCKGKAVIFISCYWTALSPPLPLSCLLGGKRGTAVPRSTNAEGISVLSFYFYFPCFEQHFQYFKASFSYPFPASAQFCVHLMTAHSTDTFRAPTMCQTFLVLGTLQGAIC